MNSKLTNEHDHLTGGGNEAWLEKIYNEKALTSHEEYVFMCINIKRFQYINDEYGRDKANEVIVILYQVLKHFLREGEYIARIYGDNFNLLLRYGDVHSCAKKFIEPFVDEIFEHEHPIIFHNIYLSFGMYFLKDGKCNFYRAQNLANISRTECPQVKERTFSYDYFNQNVYDEFKRVNQMADKVTKARFNKEFIPYIQPKIDVKTKKIIGGEVLLRWFNKESESVPLPSFLPVLNKFGDIYLVDLYIFETVCSFMHDCLLANKKITPLSFNITNTSLFDDDFIHDYTSILKKYKIPVNMVEFEFMENIQYSNYEEVKRIISTFREEGFTCALDDFGSGYSSFNILLNSQIDVVKLDRVFFNKELSEENMEVIQNIINICKKLHVKVIAEGIENEEYVKYLEQIGCDVIQGFYFYKPMPMHEFQSLLEQEL